MTIQAADQPPFRVPHTSTEDILAGLSPAEVRDHLHALQSVTEAILAHLTLPALLNELLTRLRAVLAVDSATVLLCTPDRRSLVVRASHGLEEEMEQEVQIPIGQGIAGAVAARGEAVIIDDISRVEALSPIIRRLSSLMVAPLLARGDVLGVLHVGMLSARRFTARELLLLQVVADRVAMAINNAILYDQAQEAGRASERLEGDREESEVRFRVYAESASDAIFAIDGGSIIQYANPAVERIFGYTPGELVGRNLAVLIPERMREAHRQGMERFLQTHERRIPWSGVELPGLRRDGQEISLEISFGTYERDGRQFFTGIARDVTERVRQQEQLQELAAELEVTVEELNTRTREAESANQAKSDFLAVMSHELRTPLTAIIGYSELLEMGIPEPLPDAPRKQVERIHAAAQHQLALIEEILTFSRLQAGRAVANRERVDVVEVVREAADLIAPPAGDKGLGLILDVPDSLILVSDRARIRQVATNLLSNALKFTRAGEIRVRVETQGGEALVSVTDTGIGIAPEHLPRIFDPFWQVQQSNIREAEGSGLGLSVSQRIAEDLLGGRITVESTPGNGSTFRLHLPLESP